MRDKICIITGASSGIGLATAASLAGKGATLGLVCRNRSKGESAVSTIIKKTGNNAIDLFVADMASQAEIRRLVEEINARYPRVDVLINNAGAINPKWRETIDGYETTFAVNHLGYFLLTNLLLDKFKAASKARIINVASQASRTGKIHFDDLNLKNSFSPLKSYAQSKLANIMFTYELAGKLEGSNITANCMHPGGVKTNFGSELKGIIGLAYRRFGRLMRTAEKGAETVIWLASAKEVENISGKYFHDLKEIRSIRSSYDTAAQKKLWKVSEEMVKIKSNQ